MIYNFSYFITGTLHERFSFVYTYLNELDKVFERYGCLKLMIQAHLHIGFFTIFHLSNSIDT